MKFVIILYLCTFANEPQCFKSNIIPLEFPTYYDCITQGYKYSYNYIKKFKPEEITAKKLAVKFECKEVETEKKIET